MPSDLPVNPEYPELLGYVFHLVPGVAYTYLPATAGLTVLYGLNGAGKTRILDALRATWEGVGPGASALLRLPTGARRCFDFSDLVHARLAKAWRPDLLFDGVVDPADFEVLFEGSLKQDFGEPDSELPDPFIGPLAANLDRDLLREMLQQRLILITPDGVPGSPSWDVNHAAMEEDGYPVITGELRRVLQGARMVEEGAEAPFLHGASMSADDQLMETTRLLEMGDINEHSPGPIIGCPRFAGDRTTKFEMPWLGLEVFSAGGKDLLAVLKKLLREVGVWDETGGTVAAELVDATAEIERRANELYAAFMRDAPQIELRVRPVPDWFEKEPVEWVFGSLGLALDRLSRAQGAWADWAILQAIREFRHREQDIWRTSLFLVDEPEAGLHRSAEAFMAHALSKHAGGPGRQLIVATHSPELIDVPQARVLEVRQQDPGGATLRSLTKVDLAALEGLGLNPSDLLRRQRGFLLVEGEHDERLLRTWIGDELDELRIEILPLRGASKLPGTIESRVLFDFTDAHLFVILDNISKEEVDEAWRDAELRCLADGSKVAGDLLRERLGKEPKEREWLGTWLSRALERNRNERVTPYGLRELDIIEYLPAPRLVPGSRDWASLHEEHNKARQAGAKSEFKPWLRSAKKARLSIDLITSVAMDTPTPGEILGFVDRARATLRGDTTSDANAMH